MVATSSGQAAQLQRLCSWLRRASSSSTPPITVTATSANAALRRRLRPVLASAERNRRRLSHEGWHVVSSPLDSSAYELSRASSTVTIGSASSYWSAIPSSPSSYSVTVGDKLSFRYNNYHNVYLMASQAAYDSCDFTGATELGSSSRGGGSGSTPNLYEAVVTAAGTLYIACEKGSHCQMGQKVTITPPRLLRPRHHRRRHPRHRPRLRRRLPHPRRPRPRPRHHHHPYPHPLHHPLPHHRHLLHHRHPCPLHPTLALRRHCPAPPSPSPPPPSPSPPPPSPASPSPRRRHPHPTAATLPSTTPA